MMPGLSEEDMRSLRESATDLSDICPHDLARIRRGFDRAYERARLIREGKLSPL